MLTSNPMLHQEAVLVSLSKHYLESYEYLLASLTNINMSMLLVPVFLLKILCFSFFFFTFLKNQRYDLK